MHRQQPKTSENNLFKEEDKKGSCYSAKWQQDNHIVSGLTDFFQLHNNLSTRCHTFERQLSKCCTITIVVS